MAGPHLVPRRRELGGQAGRGGDLFGVTIPRHGRSVLFVADGDNTLVRFGPRDRVA